MQENKEVTRKPFIIFTCIVSVSVAIFSVVSDNLFFINEDISIFKFVISYLAIMINSLPIWFMIAMFIGYRFANNLKEAVLFGMVYTLIAISFYLVIGHFYENTPDNISIPVIQQLMNYVGWFGASALGGLFGGAVGFLVKKSYYTLLILLVGLILQLLVNGKDSWNDIIGIAQNCTFCLIIVGIIFYLFYKKPEKLKAIKL
ncbi:hypothetical protein [Rummeliibacillus pycnus]|uniref:hypothetical protein n=1 Tax=Rummeliibacillus pycnus TaxID=101070 RepID=UPI0037CCAE47